jgi:hypothetical protein
MMNTNLLDLNNDILNIIEDYVKKDNADRMEKLIKENFKQVDILYDILNRIGQVKRKKPVMRRLIAKKKKINLTLKILELLMNI